LSLREEIDEGNESILNGYGSFSLLTVQNKELNMSRNLSVSMSTYMDAMNEHRKEVCMVDDSIDSNNNHQ
jgi:hypothetical protein